MENEVKAMIRQSLEAHIKGIGSIDNVLSNDTLVDGWLTDIMAMGFNHQDFEAASQGILEQQQPLMDCGLMPQKSIEEIRARVFLTYNRFPSEVLAFEKYVDLRDKEDEAVVIRAVREELGEPEEGNFVLF